MVQWASASRLGDLVLRAAHVQQQALQCRLLGQPFGAVLPGQQRGGPFGGPVVQDRLHQRPVPCRSASAGVQPKASQITLTTPSNGCGPCFSSSGWSVVW